MKAVKQIVGRLTLGCVLALNLIANIYGQPVPPDPGGTNDPPTPEELEAAWQAYLAKLATNRLDVLPYLHEDVKMPDGSSATSIQSLVDTQAVAFSATAEGVVSWQSSARDEALTWATSISLPTEIPLGGDLETKAYLIDREDNVPHYIMPFDLAAAVTISTTNVWPGGPTGFSLNGTNTTISVWDEAAARVSHSEFSSPTRITVLDGVTNLSSHSTAVAGVLAGSGVNVVFSNSVPFTNGAKGMAYAAKIQDRDFFSDVGEMTAAVGTNHMRLSNQSYGSVAGWLVDSSGLWYWFGNPEISGTQDPKFGNYTSNSVNYDKIVQNAPTYLSVWAAGNDQGEAPPIQPTNHVEINLQGTGYFTNVVRSADGDQGGYDTMSQQGSSKNVLTVGAVFPIAGGYSSPTNVVLAPFSSCGPTDDGRIKPDVVGSGVNNIVPTSGSDFAYASASGTSFAAPSVAGSVDLLAQFYKQLHPNASELLASTLKGLVIQTADQATTNLGPSYRFGWGLMNTRTAAILVNLDATDGLKNQIKEVLISNGQFAQFPVVSGGTNALKVTICWTDPAGTANALTNLDNPSPKLLNDLDLRVIAPNGTTNSPWILNPDLTNQTSAARSVAATTGDDARNNVEQVYLANPTSGTYTVRVTHKGNLQSNGVQWVSILLSGNVAQSPPPLMITQIVQTATNAIALGWPSVVGQQYQVQSLASLNTTNWANVGGVISARLTNVVVEVPFSTTNTAQFYRVAQVN